MGFFKLKSSRKKPKPISFYDRENRIQNGKDLKCFFNLTADHSTPASISFRGIPLAQITPQEMENKLGEPLYTLDHGYRIDGHLVYFYKNKLGNLSILMQLHFIHDVFVLAVTKFSSDFVLGEPDKAKLTAQLLSNYPPTKPTSGHQTLKFNDPEGNIIFTEENVFYFIHYVPNTPQLQKLKNQINWDNLAQSESNECTESLDNLI